MFHLIGILFFVVVAVFIVGLLIALKIINTFFNFGKRMTGNTGRSNQQTTYKRSEGASQQTENRKSAQSRTKKKVFDDDEGEYVDFEEIKD